MKFTEVLPLLERGSKVRRRSWAAGGYIVRPDVCLPEVRITAGAGNTSSYSLPWLALFADDWEVYEEPLKVGDRIVTTTGRGGVLMATCNDWAWYVRDGQEHDAPVVAHLSNLKREES